MRPIRTISQLDVALSAFRPVRAVAVALNRAVAPHDHNYVEITVVSGGRVRHRTDSGNETLGAGAVVVVPAGGCHAFDRCEGTQLYNLYFLAEWFSGDLMLLRDSPATFGLFFGRQLFGPSASCAPVSFELPPAALALATHELDLLVNLSSADTVMRLGFLKLLAILAEAGGAPATPAARPELWRALVVIEHRLPQGARLDVGEWARLSGMSEDRFRRAFGETFGISPLEYLNRRRADYAARLLLQPGATATAVAHELGFTDSAHFTRSFFRAKGLAPKAFQNSFR